MEVELDDLPSSQLVVPIYGPTLFVRRPHVARNTNTIEYLTFNPQSTPPLG